MRELVNADFLQMVSMTIKGVDTLKTRIEYLSGSLNDHDQLPRDQPMPEFMRLRLEALVRWVSPVTLPPYTSDKFTEHGQKRESVPKNSKSAIGSNACGGATRTLRSCRGSLTKLTPPYPSSW